MPRKIHVNASSHDCGYANWMEATGFTRNIEDADLVLALGGSDVSAHYYGQNDGGYLSCDRNTDALEYKGFIRAIQLKKKIIGICKGSQWGAALAGGSIFQHVRHPYYHEVTTFDGQKLLVNSTHHNMQNVLNLKENEDYKLLAWAEGISPFHFNGGKINVPCTKEPEVVFYPKINFLAIQCHPESLFGEAGSDKTINWMRDVLNKFTANKL